MAKRGAAQPRALLIVGDSVVTDPRAREALARFLPKDARDLDLTILRAGEDPIESARVSLAQVGMFSTGRAVWIRGFTGDSADGDALLEVVSAGIPDGTMLVVSAPSIDQRSRVYKWFNAHGAVEDLSIGLDKRGRLVEEDLDAFIRARLAQAGVADVGVQIVALIRQRAGTEVGNLAQEIDKLALACAATGRVTPGDVRAHVRDQAEAWVFDLTNALSERRLDAATTLLERLLAQGEPPIRLVAVLATHVADLIEAARVLPGIPSAALRNAGAFARDYFPKLPVEFRNRFKSGFRGYYVLQGANAFTYDELRKLHTALLRVDLALKSTRVAPEHLLAEIVEQACASHAD